ncbi:hypothetical protein BD779DRAFT_911357 [Infundibulicybe gibba]|nr:hypothetical protein BD779DRAFT_911357 [Infundibulicybe gibba]
MDSPADLSLLISPGQLEDIFYGFFASTIIFGISVAQVWTYINTNRDTWVMRVWIAALLIGNLAHIIMVSQVSHYYLIPRSGIAMVLASPTRLLVVEWVLNTVVQVGAQLYFARTIYLFRKTIFLPAVIVLLCMVSLVTTSYGVARPVANNTVSLGIRIEIIFFHIASLLVDIATTVGIWSMFSGKGHLVLRTRTVVEKLIMYAVARGLLLVLAQVLHLIAVMRKPGDLISWLPTQVVLSPLCICTLLAILNARTAFRETMENDSLPTVSLHFATPGQTLASRSQVQGGVRTV